MDWFFERRNDYGEHLTCIAQQEGCGHLMRLVAAPEAAVGAACSMSCPIPATGCVIPGEGI
jgi:hypothetical protein